MEDGSQFWALPSSKAVDRLQRQVTEGLLQRPDEEGLKDQGMFKVGVGRRHESSLKVSMKMEEHYCPLPKARTTHVSGLSPKKIV